MKDEAKRFFYLLGIGVAGLIAFTIYLKMTTSKDLIKDTSFKLPLASGGELDSASMLGMPMIVNFWASWCDACKEEEPQVEKLAAYAKDRMLGIGTFDKKENLIAYDKAHPFGFRILLDEDGAVSTRYLVTGLPQTFLIAADGSVKARVVGAMKDADVQELMRLMGDAQPR